MADLESDTGDVRIEENLRNVRRWRFLHSAGAPIAAWALVAPLSALVFTVRFMTNDDGGMAAFASGDYTGSPSAHLVFINIIPGFVISRLSMLTNAIPWYLVVLHAYAAISLGVITDVWRRHTRSLTGPTHFVVLVAVATLASAMLVIPTFTVSAMVATIAAVTLLVDTAAGRPKPWWCVAAALSLLAASAALRFDSLLGGLVMSAPALAWCVRPLGLRKVGALAIGGISIVAVLSIATRISENQDWRTYREFNAVRGTMHGTKQLTATLVSWDTPPVQEALADNEWTRTDLRLFGQWFIEDPSVYNVATLTRLQATVDDFATENSWADAWSDVLVGHRGLASLVVCAGIALALGGPRRLWFAVAATAWVIGASVWVARSERFPLRIALPLLVGATITLSFCGLLIDGPKWRWTATARRVADATFFVTLGALAIQPLFAYQPFHLSAGNDASIEFAHERMELIRAVDDRGTYVILGASADVFDRPSTEAPGVFHARDFVTTGWNSQSPTQRVRLGQLGLASDLVGAAVDQPHIWFVAGPKDLKSIVRVARERHRLHLVGVIGASIDNGRTIVFRLRSG